MMGFMDRRLDSPTIEYWGNALTTWYDLVRFDIAFGGGDERFTDDFVIARAALH